MTYYDRIWLPWRVRGNGTTIANKREWRKLKRWNELAALSDTPTCRVLLDVDIWDIDARVMPDASRTIWRTIDATPNLTWLVLTRYAGIAQVIRERRLNLWLGVDVSTQQEADELIPALLKCRELCGKLIVRVTVTERLKIPIKAWGPQSEGEWLNVVECGHKSSKYGISWLILQGDVGRKATPCNVAHVRELIRQAREAGVPCWVERLGSRPYDGDAMLLIPGHDRRMENPPTDEDLSVFGRMLDIAKMSLADPHGADPAEWPEDLRAREVPT